MKRGEIPVDIALNSVDAEGDDGLVLPGCVINPNMLRL
jgi:hypothetical protein